MTALREYMNTDSVSREASDNLSTLAKCIKQEDIGFVPIKIEISWLKG
ncbi:hypothetical protein SAMN05192559_11447 [Halobacillus karajensis]|nr:hypothetical protein [Halobacillus karajensis]SEI12072.1 hypothetical protein SAMN05192559_11447 [Halobacillus karajensis]